jgi:hypothetical protein
MVVEETDAHFVCFTDCGKYSLVHKRNVVKGSVSSYVMFLFVV